MTLGILLSLGDSFKDMAKSGRDIQFKKFYLNKFAKSFSKIYIFSYENEIIDNIPENVEIIPNKLNFHRYLYAIIFPFLHFKIIAKCDVLRVYHLSGTIPAILCKLAYDKKYIFNYAYDYSKFAQIEKKRPQAIMFRIVKPLAISMASKIFYANHLLLNLIPNNKAVHLPNGVDIDLFKPIKNKKKSPKTKILAVGRLENQKNLGLLIRAVSKTGGELKIVGQGSLKKKLVDLAKNLHVNLSIIPTISYNQMPKIYNDADIFVLPSVIEGHPKVLLEAMACALPVVGTDVEGTKEIITNKKNGILISPTIENIVKSINLLQSSSSLRIQLGKTARNTIKSNFDLNKLITKEIKHIKRTVL